MSRRRRDRRAMLQPELMLAAMVDMLVNILIFLLHLYGTAPVETSNPDLELPQSLATDPVVAAPIVVLTVNAVEVDGEPLVSLTTGMEGGIVYPEGSLEAGQIPPLARWLTERRARMIERRPEEEPPNTIMVECDRRVPWSVVAPVLSTSGSVGFTQFRFIVNTVTEVD